MARVRIFSGGGRYGDPWHPFTQTSAAVADILTGAGHGTEVVRDLPASLTDLGAVDVLVVNAGGQPTEEIVPDPEWAAAFDDLGRWLNQGGRLLGLHTAANAFPDWPDWPARLGGRWVRGTSFHPERSEASFGPCPGAAKHPVWDGLDTVEADDERYSSMEVAPGSVRLVQHVTDGVTEVMGWANGGHVLYDGLGHDARSYESPSRARLLLNEVSWLLG